MGAASSKLGRITGVAAQFAVHMVGGETLYIESEAPDDELATKLGSGSGVIEGTVAGQDRRVVIAARSVAYIEATNDSGNVGMPSGP